MLELVLAIHLGLTVQSPGRPNCSTIERVDQQLRAEPWLETPHLWGLLPSGQIFVVYGNEDTGTWTATMQDISTLRMCVLGSGTDWGYLDQKATGDEL